MFIFFHSEASFIVMFTLHFDRMSTIHFIAQFTFIAWFIPSLFSRRAQTSCQRATPKTLISLTSIWQISSLTPFHHNRFLSFHVLCPQAVSFPHCPPPPPSLTLWVSMNRIRWGPRNINQPVTEIKSVQTQERNLTVTINVRDWQTVEPWRRWCVNVMAVDSLLHHS